MEKQKKEASRFSKKRLWGCFGFLLFICFGIFGLLVIIPSFFGHIPQTLLAPAIVPTAEALSNASYSVRLSDDIGFYLDVMENFTEDEDAICVRGGSSDESRLDALHNNSSLFIDEVWIMGASSTGIWFGGYIEGTLSWCATGELQPGIHLIEFHLKDSFWGEPIHIQQWAIEID